MNPVSGGETKTSISAWTVDSLREHLGQQLEERDRRLEAIRHEQAGALSALDHRIGDRFHAQNEAREAADKRYEQRFVAQEGAVQSALLAQEKAVIKAESSAEKRFEAMNEFRGQLKDQAATLLARDEANARFEALTDKIDGLTARLTESEKRTLEALAVIAGRTAGKSEGWGVLLGAVGLIAALGSIVGMLLKR